jgi:5-methylcytosine-specific restriction endonuclease McrA
MAIGYGVACPKPATKLVDRVAYKKEREAKERAFRQAVWTRDKSKCQRCGVKVIKTLALDAKRGEVHHLKPRSLDPGKRYDVNNGQLVCALCHQKLTRHEL